MTSNKTVTSEGFYLRDTDDFNLLTLLIRRYERQKSKKSSTPSYQGRKEHAGKYKKVSQE